jgi:TolB-like protein/tetratricopeptide (TPR) repeat protein
MAPEEKGEQSELERSRLLEAIRKRAEEAEMRRIEEEERRVEAERAAATPPPVPEESPHEAKIKEVREKLSIALDRGKTDKAKLLIEELRGLPVDEGELRGLQERLLALEQEEEEKAAEARRAAQRKVAQPAARSAEVKKKIAELFDQASSAYQYEQYDQTAARIAEILALDPENNQALDLDEKLQAARLLSEQIKQEEALRKAEEEKLFAKSQAEPAPPPVETQGDMWESKVPTPQQDDFSAPGEIVAPGPPKPSLAERSLEIISRIRIPRKVIVVAAAVVAVGLLAYVIKDLVETALLRPKPSVLVLPAKNLAPDGRREYVADGLTEDLVAELSAVPELRVIAPATSLSLKRSTETQLTLARSFGVGYLVRWSLLEASEGFRVDVELRDTVAQHPLWTSRFQNTLRELPTVKREIARAIIRETGVEIPEGSENAVAPPSTSIPAAYDAYLRGRSLLQRSDSASTIRAAAAFTTAVEADPQFADGYTALAWADLVSFDAGWDTARATVAKAISYISQAAALGAKTSERYCAKGLAEQLRNSFDEAVQQLELAVTVAPSDAESQRRLSYVYLAKNRIEEAGAAAQTAIADDPQNLASYLTLALVERFRGDFKSALEIYRHAIPLAPDAEEFTSTYVPDLLVYTTQADSAIKLLDQWVATHRSGYVDYYRLGRAYQIAGRPKQVWQKIFQRAVELLDEETSRKPDDPRPLAFQALVRTRLGEFKRADSIVVRLNRFGALDAQVLYDLARVYAVRREKPQSLIYLERAMQNRYRLERALDMDFYNLRSDPEFLQAITR